MIIHHQIIIHYGMMKKIINSECIGILGVLAVSCTNSEDSTDFDYTNNPEKKITIQVGINIKDEDSLTRVIYTDSNVGSKSGPFTWEQNDSLIAVGYDTSNNYQGISMFKLTSGEDSVYGSFTGGEITTATKYNVYYKSKSISINPSTGEPTYTTTEQEQSADRNTAHIKANLYLSAIGITNFKNLTLEPQHCIMKFILSNIPSNVGSLKKLLWENETSKGTNSIALSFANENITFNESMDSLTAFIAFDSNEMDINKSAISTNGLFTVTLQGDKTYAIRYGLKTKNYIAGTRYNAIRNKETGTGWTKLGESVDLGLPSGTKWATYNIGATSPTDAGYYYAWGETDMQIENTSASYKYAKENIGTEIQGTDYDVATAKWGSSWTMPTKKQMQELIDNCTWTWDATKKGYTVTGKNGNCIFLPAAGYRANSKTSDAGSELRYWCTESDGTTTNIQGYGFSGNSTSKTTDKQYNTYYGFTVRPVTK